MRFGLILILFISAAMANEHGAVHHEAHVSDLMWPIFNFVLFFGFLVYKIRKPIKEGFDKNAELIKELFEYAKAKDQDAQNKIGEYKDKMKNFHLEVEKLNKEMEEEFVVFKRETTMETEMHIQRAGADAKRKAESEKNRRTKEINEELLNNIILKTKESLGSNSSLRNKATSKIIAAL